MKRHALVARNQRRVLQIGKTGHKVLFSLTKITTDMPSCLDNRSHMNRQSSTRRTGLHQADAADLRLFAKEVALEVILEYSLLAAAWVF